MAAAGRIDIDLFVNDQAALTGLRSSLQKVETQTRDTTEKMNSGFVAAGAAVATTVVAMVKFVDVMQDAIKAASESEDAMKRLDTALRLQGFTAKAVTTAYQEMAAEFQAATRFSDEAIAGVQQKLITLGNVGPASMKRVTQATLDLSSALKIDLESAATLVGKAAIGETAALSRYGLVIDQNLSDSEKFAELLKLIETRMGGSAQEDAKTYTGALAQLKNAMDEVLEQLGAYITKSELVEGAMKGMTDGALNLADALKKSREEGSAAAAANLEAIRNAPDMKNFLQGRAEAERPSSESNFLRNILGNPAERSQAASQAAQDLAQIHAEQEQAEQEHQARLAGIRQLFQDTTLQSLIADTETGKILKAEEAQDHIQKNQAIVTSDLAVANLDAATHARLVQYKQALNEAEKNAQKAKQAAQLASVKAQFQTELDMAQATADLVSAVASLSGKSSVKAVAIVLQAVVTAVNIMLTTVNPFLALIKIATTAVSAAAALSQLSQAEKALDASRSQNIQAVTTVPGFADGVTNFSGGLAVVGERGPELVRLPAGSDVIPNGAGVGGMQVYITINNPIMTTEEATRSIAKQLASQVSQFIAEEKDRL